MVRARGKTLTHEQAAESSYKKRTGMGSKDAAAVVERCRKHVEASYNYDRNNRNEAEIDLNFVAGDQWPEAVKSARAGTPNTPARPMLVINQLPQFVNQVVNPIRQADIGIKVKGTDGETDPKIARIYDQIIDDIEQASSAKQVYTTGNEHQVKCGIGWWRVKIEYCSADGFDKELRIAKIEHPLSVYPDPGARKPTCEDGMRCAVVEQWPIETFKTKWPKATAQTSVDTPGNGPTNFQWATVETIAVAEYWEKEAVAKTLAMNEAGEVKDITDLEDEEIEQLEAESPIVATRECTDYRVVKYVVSGTEVLEKRVVWPGKHIPIVRVNGSETPIKNGVYRYGLVRFARDPQALMNFYRTATAEAIALAPKTPWLVTDGMIEGYEQEWHTVNQTNKPFLRWRPDKAFPNVTPQRPNAPDVPSALTTEAQYAADDLKRTMGIYDASLGARSNETSGVAIHARESQGDTANGHFEDNMMHALVHTGKILVDLIPKVYDTQRIIRLTDPKGKEEPVTINRTLYSYEGEDVVENDISQSRFDVRVTVGKNFATRRVEAVASLLEFAKTLPPQAQMLFIDLIAKNSDFPEADELARRLRTLVPPEALADPNDPNAPKPKGPMDDPMFVAKLESEAAKTEEVKARTERIRQADIQDVKAKTLKTLVEADALDGEMGSISVPSVNGGHEGLSETPPDFQGGNFTLQ